MKNFSLISHQDSIEMVYNDHSHIVGVSYIPLEDGEYINLITREKVWAKDGKITIKDMPMILV